MRHRGVSVSGRRRGRPARGRAPCLNWSGESRISTAPGPSRWPLSAACLIFAGVAVLLLAEPLARLPLLVPRDFNEGWNAYHAAALFGPEALYPDPGGLFANNYPPLSFVLVGGLSALTGGDPVVVGRAVAIASLAVVAALDGAIVARRGGSALAGVAASTWLLAHQAGWRGIYVGLNDPQWLGHALATGGLALLAWTDRPGGRRLFAAEVLMLAAGLVKHNLLPLPAAVALWLLWHDRRAALRWIAWGAALSVVSLAACRLAFGEAFLGNVLGAEGSRLHSFGSAARRAREHLPALLPGLALAAWAVASLGRAGGDRFARLVGLYGLLALGLGTYSLGGSGVDVNALFDLEIAVAVGVGLALASLSDGRHRPVVAAGIAGAAVALLVAVPPGWRSWRAFAATTAGEQRTVRSEVELVRAQPGEVVCEALALCFWAGKPRTVDLFSVTTRLRGGSLPEAAMLGPIAAGRFGLVQLDLPHGTAEGVVRSVRVPPRVLDGWLKHLEPVRWTRGPSARVYLAPPEGRPPGP